jgi:UDP:flavonoid glycosyltransferase YjiC (YdhE family)
LQQLTNACKTSIMHCLYGSFVTFFPPDRHMKLLLAAQTNSLSHLAKCLATRTSLLALGHEVLLAAGRRHQQFLGQLGVTSFYLPSLQNDGENAFPSIDWFMYPEKIQSVITAERELLRKIRPDRILGVFRFTMKASAQLAGIPYDSLICGCMLPEVKEGLGFLPEEAGANRAHEYMSLFFGYAGARISQALRTAGLPAVKDAREMLCGERTFLWDFPDFMPVPRVPGRYHIGPVLWKDWPSQRQTANAEEHSSYRGPLAVVSFGTSVGNLTATKRIVHILLGLGFRVALAAGGQKTFVESIDWGPRVRVFHFAPMSGLLSRASLLICHGGQMTIFDALAHRVPTVVLPFQPEQAHNGACLERLGCGRRLLPPTHFFGDSQVYLKSLAALGDDDIAAVIESLHGCPAVDAALAKTGARLESYTGVDILLPLLLKGVS